MNESNVQFGSIPPIGSSQIGIDNTAQATQTPKKPDIPMFDNAPNDVSFGSFFGKIVIGVIAGICVAALLFATLSLGKNSSQGDSASSIMRILLPIAGFIVNFIGSLALALLFNIFFSKRYYNFGKMAGLIFVSSLILFVFFFIIYFLFNGESVISLYTVLGFQMIFGLYISLNLIDFLSQPNYSASSLMGNTLGCVLSVVIFLGIIHGISDPLQIALPVLLASSISYAITIFGAGIRDAIYYKFYEWGNNPFYLPSLNELREERKKEETKKAKEEESVNVDMK